MANPDGITTTDPEKLAQLRALLPDFTNPAGVVNWHGLSRAMGQNRETTKRWYGKITAEAYRKAQEDYTPDTGDLGAQGKPRHRVRAYNPNTVLDLPVRRVVAIGDVHVRPGASTEHMRWIGRYVASVKPDNVVQIGDFFDFESCEFHSAPGSASNANRPSFEDDIAAGEEIADIYHAEVGIGEIPHDVTQGNHEYRPFRLEELSPNLAGTLTGRMDQFFARYRWKVTPYRHWLFLEGVGFTHVPMTIMGKPIGGRYPENNIGNQSTHSIVFGHTHRANHITVPKIGINNSISVTNVGSAMEYGYTPKFAEGSTTGYSYGVADLRLRGGRVEGFQFISILDLKDRFA